MSEKIYISRKCEYCHELLILLHKHKDILKFPVIDVHSNPYPNIVKSVPCMVVDGKILPGDELFKFVTTKRKFKLLSATYNKTKKNIQVENFFELKGFEVIYKSDESKKYQMKVKNYNMKTKYNIATLWKKK